MTANALAILKDDGTLAKYRKGARRSASRFDISHVLPLYEALYEEVVEQARVHGVHQ